MKAKSNNIDIHTIVAVVISIVLIAADFCIGYYVGRKSVKPKKVVEIKWIKGETIKDTIYLPDPYEIVKNDTVKEIYEVVVKDTERIKEILDEFYCEKKYLLDFSNDTVGEFKVDMAVRENSLIYANSEITPLIKTITETNYIPQPKKIIGGYAIAGTSLKFNTQRLGAGVIVNERFLIGVTGIRLKKEFNYTIDFGVKF